MEFDLEGNFSAVDNRNLSSIRSNAPSLRLAYARVDYHFDQNNTFSALFGQDWTLFGSSTLPNILETTGLGIDFGTFTSASPDPRRLYPQAGFLRDHAGVLRSTSRVRPGGRSSDQIGYGERQAPDSSRPNIRLDSSSRASWTMPRAFPPPKSSSAALRDDGPHVLAAAVPTALASTIPELSGGLLQPASTPAVNRMDGMQSGSSPRAFSPSSASITAARTSSSTSPANCIPTSTTPRAYHTVAVSDVEATARLAQRHLRHDTPPAGRWSLAPQRPVRSQGGFAQLGIPLSRLFNANPAGRNAGWSIYALYGIDQAKRRDLNRPPSRDALQHHGHWHTQLPVQSLGVASPSSSRSTPPTATPARPSTLSRRSLPRVERCS